MSFYCVYGYADNDCGWTEDFSNLEDAKARLLEIMAEDGEDTKIVATEGGENSIVHYKTGDGYNYGISMFS